MQRRCLALATPLAAALSNGLSVSGTRRGAHCCAMQGQREHSASRQAKSGQSFGRGGVVRQFPPCSRRVPLLAHMPELGSKRHSAPQRCKYMRPSKACARARQPQSAGQQAGREKQPEPAVPDLGCCATPPHQAFWTPLKPSAFEALAHRPVDGQSPTGRTDWGTPPS